MDYALLLYRMARPSVPAAELEDRATLAAHRALQVESSGERGLYAGARLDETRTARTVRPRGGGHEVTDGLPRGRGAPSRLALEAMRYPYVHIVRASLLAEVGDAAAADRAFGEAERVARNAHERGQVRERRAQHRASLHPTAESRPR